MTERLSVVVVVAHPDDESLIAGGTLALAARAGAGCGGVALFSDFAEVKRMYVVPSARRAGHARVVLTHLEETAREAGADVMVLETGVRQPEALGLYRAAGYLPVEGFGFYKEFPNVRYVGKRL